MTMHVGSLYVSTTNSIQGKALLISGLVMFSSPLGPGLTHKKLECPAKTFLPLSASSY